MMYSTVSHCDWSITAVTICNINSMRNSMVSNYLLDIIQAAKNDRTDGSDAVYDAYYLITRSTSAIS